MSHTSGTRLGPYEMAGPLGREVYVQSVPASANTWKMSNNGGIWPQWGRDGKGLFYAIGRK